MVLVTPLLKARFGKVTAGPSVRTLSPLKVAGSYCSRKAGADCEKSNWELIMELVVKEVEPAGDAADKASEKSGDDAQRNATSSPACKGSSPLKVKFSMVVAPFGGALDSEMLVSIP